MLLLSIGCAPNKVDNHSAGKDPDLAPTDTMANIAREIHVGEQALASSQPRELPPAALPEVDIVDVAPSEPLHVVTARKYLGVTENPKDSNRGTEVEQFLGSVGLKPIQRADGTWKSYPYCAAFVSFCLNAAGEEVVYPRTRTAGARNFIDNARSFIFFPDGEENHPISFGSLRANVVQRGTVTIPPGTIVVWKAKRDPDDPYGHAGMVVSWEGQAGLTIEGNTGPGEEGDQREGGGVYLRKRMLSPGSAFRIVSFTPVNYR
ncbi:MAG: CHAP domain-containing protein [Rhodothermales bacterium]